MTILTAKSGYAQLSELIISEYVEGSSNNKYIEIYNGTGATVDLSDYQLRRYTNGSSSSTNATLSGNLADNSVIVYANGSATAYSGTVTTLSLLTFNGDDAIALYNTNTASFADIVGNIGCDPGSRWQDGSHDTENNTLVRKNTVCAGVTTDPGNSPCSFPTMVSEWDVYAVDFVDSLGSHFVSCAAGCTPPTTQPSAITFTSIGLNGFYR